MRVIAVIAIVGAATFGAANRASAQPLGTFRWNTAPFCNVLSLTVTQVGATFTLDGFEEQCGGNPRLPTHGVAVPQPNGTVTLGLTVVSSPGNPDPWNLEAVISPATVSGTWRDSAGGSGNFVFNPAGTSGGPRPTPSPSGSIPGPFSFLADGLFVAGGTLNSGTTYSAGLGSKMFWYPKKAAFRAGNTTIPAWDDVNVGIFSAAFGQDTVAGGKASTALGVQTLASGEGSLAAGFGTIAEGPFSQAFGYFTYAGSNASMAMGTNTQAIGAYAFAGGANAIARGTSSMAFGNGEALANAHGSFVWGDVSTSTKVVSDLPNQFIVRASGGFRFASNSAQSTGVYLLPGSNQFTQISDVNKKALFRDLDGEDVLRKVARLPIPEWSYTAQGPSIRHIGPMAQDFYAEFGLGEDPLGIGTLDGTGVALAGVKALEARTREMNETLRRESDALKAELAALRDRLDRLEAKQQ